MTKFEGVVPYLFYDDIAATMEWYERVFGFEDVGRWTNDEGQIQNAEMRFGSSELWLDGGGKRWFDKDGKPAYAWIGIYIDDVDAMYDKVKAAGVEAEPPVDRDFGVRMLTVADPEGYQWGFLQRIS